MEKTSDFDPSLAADPPGGWPVPKSLYLHVPFCRHRCGYCNFSVLAGRDDLQDRFLDAVERELSELQGRRGELGEDRGEARDGRSRRSTMTMTMAPIELDTLYLGGGTPTQLTPPRLRRLFHILSERVSLAEDAEFTCEANPEDLTTETLTGLVEGGVNRLSLGVQSFDDAKLETLQRSHSGEEAVTAIRRAGESIGNISIDLIFAAPGETSPAWQRDLDTACELPIEHISTYSLTYEKGTEFWSRRRQGTLQPVSEDTDIEMYHASRQTLTAAGFQQYEISSFAKQGARSRHNSVYWNGHGWYAVGPSAARFVDGWRDVNHRSPTTYLKQVLAQGSAVAERERIELDQHAREIAAFGIRQIDGIDLQEINRRVGYDFAATIDEVVDRFVKTDTLIRCGHHIRLTEQGLLFADMVESQILD
ncbi:radical SAM family heme chaperone HemW [Allorhodopirellula solitaria]|uniref:Heme chaperone HemW n=1 Tax=Allorhodopirellula solitaria TaxID=2527987 RepID=A0A5C5X092_9BACT|nr:radical SAM family heme chaperone HemW [Allorhodopirellula solitaria]TWT56009.1 Oxygen-independent coproporphyrinogen-III oxidase-like protein [Allorhodopirellula solitaria]